MEEVGGVRKGERSRRLTGEDDYDVITPWFLVVHLGGGGKGGGGVGGPLLSVGKKTIARVTGVWIKIDASKRIQGSKRGLNLVSWAVPGLRGEKARDKGGTQGELSNAHFSRGKLKGGSY